MDSRLVNIDFAGRAFYRVLLNIRAANDHPKILGSVGFVARRKKLCNRLASDESSRFDARAGKNAQIFKIEVKEKSKDRRRPLDKPKRTSLGQPNGVSFEKETFLIGRDMETCEIECDVGFLALVLRLQALVLEPLTKLDALVFQLFGIFENFAKGKEFGHRFACDAITRPRVVDDGKGKQLWTRAIGVGDRFEIDGMLANGCRSIGFSKRVIDVHEKFCKTRNGLQKLLQRRPKSCNEKTCNDPDVSQKS